MASPVSSLLGASNTGSAATGSSSSALNGSQPPNEQMFLQLLVSQIQNQDPLNPTDSTQFVSQLAQFSELEQVIGIRGDIETAMGINSNSSGTPGAATTGTTPGSGTNTPAATPGASPTPQN